MTAPKNADWVTGLRELADWLEAHPDVDLIRFPPEFSTVLGFDLKNQDIRAFAARHGLDLDRQPPRPVTRTETVHKTKCSKTFGPITVNARTRSITRKPSISERIKAVFS